MSGFTFLTKEQCFESDKLDILEKRGTKAAITDFSILLGGSFDRAQSLEGRAGKYWLKSEDGRNGARTVDSAGYRKCGSVKLRLYGARPALLLSSISSIPTNGESGKRARDGVLEVEYGYYPQKAVSIDMQEKLERAFQGKSLSRTGNKYTTDSRKHEYEKFGAKQHEEFQLDGKRYVRVKANSCFSVNEWWSSYGGEFKLSNGKSYINGDPVWVEVAPVKWLVDERAKMMLTDKVIFSGVQFNREENYHTGDFYKTDIKKFMDTYFARELVQSRGIGQQSQTIATSTTIKNDSVEINEREKEQQTRSDLAEKNKKEELQHTITAREDRSPYDLKFDEVSESDIIKGAIESNVSIFLHGKPGCGKSDRVKQLDPDFIELNLSHLDPELLDGLAGEKDGKAVHIKPPWLEELEAKCQEEPDKIHILFLEELTNASQMMQSKAYGIALDKKVAGRWKLPENVRVVAAGNELEDSLVANEIAEPLYDRFAHVNIETSAANWLEWAATPENFYERLDYKKQDESKQKIHPAIYAYIAYKGEDVLRTPYNREKPEPHADPRRWKMASDMLYASNNPHTLRAIIGEDLTENFVAFCKTRTITVQDVINGNYTEQDLIMDLGRQLATVSGLVRVDDENMPKVREFVKKLGPEMCKKFEVQWAGGNEERLEQIQELRLIEQEAVKENVR